MAGWVCNLPSTYIQWYQLDACLPDEKARRTAGSLLTPSSGTGTGRLKSSSGAKALTP